MKGHSYKIALIQLNLNNIPSENLKKSIIWIKHAARDGAKIVCLPELYSSFYFCQTENTENFKFAVTPNDSSFKIFSDLAAELGIVIIVPFFEKRAAGIYHNSLYIIDSDGKRAGHYRKMHIPDDPGYYEKYYFTPGDLGFKAFNTNIGKIGALICWDQWYPEAARLVALQGAEILFYPTAIGWHPAEKMEHGNKQLDAWLTVQRGHAIANGIFVGAVNRVGLEKIAGGGEGIEFWGSSFICGPQGEILAMASTFKEEILMADVDNAILENIRQNWPFLRDRRIDAYGEIVKRSIE